MVLSSVALLAVLYFVVRCDPFPQSEYRGQAQMDPYFSEQGFPVAGFSQHPSVFQSFPMFQDSSINDGDGKTPEDVVPDRKDGILQNTREAVSNGFESVNNMFSSAFHGVAKAVGGAAGALTDMASGFAKTAGEAYDSMTEEENENKPNESNGAENSQ